MSEDNDILLRSKDAKAIKDQWRDMYEKVYSLALHYRNLFNEKSEGQDKAEQVIDTTLYSSMMRSANVLQSGIMPPFQKWADYVLGPQGEAMAASEDQKLELQKLLAPRRDAAFAALDSSDFNSAISEWFLEILIGTGILKIEAGITDDKILDVTAVPLATAYIEEGIPGTHTALFRDLVVKGRNIQAMWPDAKLGPDQEAFIKSKKNDDVELMDATYTNVAPGEIGKEWFYEVYISRGGRGEMEKGERILRRKIPRWPYIITHWMKVAGETYGRGPAMFAYHEAAMLNEVRRLVIENAELAIGPPLLVREDGVLAVDQITLESLGVNVVGDTSGSARGASIEPLNIGANFEVGQFIMADMVSTIHRIMMDDALPPDDVGAKSATEIVAKQRQLATDQGAPFGRLIQNGVRPIFALTDRILVEKGILEKSQAFKIDGGVVDIRVTAPLAQAQARVEIEAIVDTVGITKELLGEEIANLTFKTEDIGAVIGGKRGMDPTLIRTNEEKALLQQQMAQIQAAQMQGQEEGGTPNAGAA